MALRFNIENETRLADGGPTSFAVTGRRTVDIGRDRHLDWTLPDPSRLISAKHCEVQYRDGGYWLHDVSTNGTFLNGADHRMRGPHKLRNGDRFVVGHYIIGVSLDSGEGQTAGLGTADDGAARPKPDYAEIWNVEGDVPSPVDRNQLKTPREAARPVKPEFLDWAASVPEPDSLPRRFAAHVARDGHDQSLLRDNAHPSPLMLPPQRAGWTEFAWQDDRSAAPGPSASTSASASPQPHWPGPAEYSISAQQGTPRLDSASAQIATDPDIKRGEPTAFARQLATALGLPDDFFADKDPAEVAERVGAILRMTVGGVMELLKARNQARQMVRCANQTTVQVLENNPLKLLPTAEEAIKNLFGRQNQNYLDAHRAFANAFEDLKDHQLNTYVAMQQAVVKLVASVDPKALAREVEGGSSWLGSSKSKLWDVHLMRWTSVLGDGGSAPVDAFMRHFADFYNRGETFDKK